MPNQERTCTIYGLCRSDNSSIRYVGQTYRSVDSRLSQHLRLAMNGKKSPLYAWIRKVISGGTTVQAVILEADATWNSAERRWIADLRSEDFDLLNLTSGGQGSARLGELNSAAKLTDADVLEIRNSRLSNKTLAARFGVRDSVICSVRTGKLWGHVGGDIIAAKSRRCFTRFFDGQELTAEGCLLVQSYRDGETMTALAARFSTARPTIRRMFSLLQVYTRPGGIKAHPIYVNGRAYQSVQQAMRGEKIGYTNLIASAGAIVQ